LTLRDAHALSRVLGLDVQELAEMEAGA